ncbi:MAG: NAD(P)H-dependent oxidoreductase [Armatimonadaceae bacterium]
MTEQTVHVLIVSTSLNPDSRSFVLAEYAATVLRERNVSCEAIDLRKVGEIPMAGSPTGWNSPVVRELRQAMQKATHLIFAVPVYNFSAGAVAKNVIELMGSAELEGKTVGFLCAAGGGRGYMSILPLANAMMLDFRCWIVPRFVYATRADVEHGAIKSDEIRTRIEQMLTELFERVPVSKTSD